MHSQVQVFVFSHIPYTDPGRSASGARSPKKNLSYVFYYFLLQLLFFPLKNPKNPLCTPSKIYKGGVLMGNSDFC